MITLSPKEKKAFEALALKLRKENLKYRFKEEPVLKDKDQNDIEKYFEQNIDATLLLDHMGNQEILNILLIAILSESNVADTPEFKKCASKRKWYARGLYLSTQKEEYIAKQD